jgi:hypothetical protein
VIEHLDGAAYVELRRGLGLQVIDQNVVGVLKGSAGDEDEWP